MNHWEGKLDLTSVWKNEGLKFEQRRDAIVALAKAKSYYRDDDEYELIVDNLADSRDEDEFDQSWEELYDWADSNRVWIATVF